MSSLKYKISVLATNDLEDIYASTSVYWSESQADSYYESILTTLDLICTHPLIGQSLTEERSDLRIRKVQSHLILYRIEGDYILVERILHQRMDIDGLLDSYPFIH